MKSLQFEVINFWDCFLLSSRKLEQNWFLKMECQCNTNLKHVDQRKEVCLYEVVKRLSTPLPVTIWEIERRANELMDFTG